MNSDIMDLCQMVVNVWKGKDIDEEEFEEIMRNNGLELCTDCDIVESTEETTSTSIRKDFQELATIVLKLIQDGNSPNVDELQVLVERNDFKIHDYDIIDKKQITSNRGVSNHKNKS